MGLNSKSLPVVVPVKRNSPYFGTTESRMEEQVIEAIVELDNAGNAHTLREIEYHLDRAADALRAARAELVNANRLSSRRAA